MIIEFDNINSLCDFIKLIKTLREVIIDYIYNDNNIIYASKNYLNNLKDNFVSKYELINRIEKNKLNINLKEIFNILY